MILKFLKIKLSPYNVDILYVLCYLCKVAKRKCFLRWKHIVKLRIRAKIMHLCISTLCFALWHHRSRLKHRTTWLDLNYSTSDESSIQTKYFTESKKNLQPLTQDRFHLLGKVFCELVAEAIKEKLHLCNVYD